MNETDFRSVIMTPRIEEICRNMKNVWEEAEPQIQELGLESFMRIHSNGEIPFSETEIATAFKQYMLDAEQLQEMFETTRLRQALSRLFTQLSSTESVKLGFWDYNGRYPESWRILPCDIRAHTHNHCSPGHKEELCRELQKPVADKLFAALLASLISAEASIVQLEIECISDRNFVWADDGSLDNLDLSRLRALRFDPIDVDDMYHWSEERASTAKIRCGLAICALLQKCSSALHKLSVTPDYAGRLGYFEWPTTKPKELPSLSALESFTTGLRLDLPAFAQFLHQSPALRFLQLNGCHGALEHWRHLWDAIRDHPNRMMLDFDQLPCNEATEYSGSHHTGEASTAVFDADPGKTLHTALKTTSLEEGIGTVLC
ncbi:hypothetical protein E8E13_010001 [Curvularia kusanoi]|uniref:Uncharacterized protein n=1 Tax=Curvularia kusanoi TaxID=90978 RepID=A0A9P4W8P8_CURKU|nr:hypothetical protein E8E13_010001 [Curvularia kusanoi]